LTKGTDEWKQALASVNNEVLSLLERFPGLEVAIGENGNLTVK
jgi:hypothetical protein